MNTNEKRAKARAEAQPKKILEIEGYTISADERNYIVNGKKMNTHYHSSLELALADIQDHIERSVTHEGIKNLLERLESSRQAFLKALSTRLPLKSRELRQNR